MWFEKYGKIITFIISLLVGFGSIIQEVLLGTELSTVAFIGTSAAFGAIIGLFCFIVASAVSKKKDWWYIGVGIIGSLIGGVVALVI